ncbi:tRNA nucleotidyltransferase cca2 isoform X1 [Beta vulgaris subsp. vulgaris]|uniref:tRNA nucleotidyltransferase cca2 isoform X1 n=1 Tax=Beta vulgaris subsp. vulgaris TaxID=3555 RepID=UPI002036CDEF|nr:tRNA nucleotidyltransferase cca2 isoform X1 [Beta vulgaris subsp. vulgaris]
MVHLHGVVFSREAINGCTKMRVLAPISQRFISNTKFSLSLQNYHSLQLPFLLQTPFKFPSLLNPPKTLRCFLHCRATMAVEPTSNVQIKDEIHLTEKETLIFNRLKDVLHHFNLNTQLRVAGGWVRDKLLGKDCYDIDIAIDNMMGRELCEKINEYLLKTGEDVQGIGVIQCNPDQSKHLETARMRLFDLWIDFVNLRAEDYSENSRIPTMRFGTPEEDAYRRDLTINSLFYNINTDSVEDITGRGIADLKLGKIVTPLPPKETFLDDPLRVLRAIRFGARFCFVLDEGLKEAAASHDVRTAIADKISRERIGHEIDLMMGGNQPVKAVTYICDVQLFWVVFSLPSNVEPSPAEASHRLCLAFMDSSWRLIQSLEALVLNVRLHDEQRRLCLYAALFLPLRSMIYRDKKKKKIPAVDYIFRSSLKLKAKDPETVISVHRATEKFIPLISYITSEKDVQHVEAQCGKILIDVPETSKLRILTGLLLREIKDFWPVALLVSTLLYPDDGLPESSVEDNLKLEKCRELFKLVKDKIMKLGLENIWEAKPLVNGKDIMSILNLKAGPNVKEWQQKVIEWQLAYPSGTADECQEWLREAGAKRAKTNDNGCADVTS